MNDSKMSPRTLLRLLPQAGCCALTSPIKSSGAWIWLTKSSSSLSVGSGAVGDIYKEIAHTWVCPILSLTATQFSGVLSYCTMRDTIGYKDGCSASSVLVVYVMCVPRVPWDSVPLVKVSKMGFLDCSHDRSSSENFSCKLRPFCD